MPSCLYFLDQLAFYGSLINIMQLASLIMLTCPCNKYLFESNRNAMNRNWSNQKENHALKTKTGNKYILQIDKIQ